MWLTTDKLVPYYGKKYGSFLWHQRIIKVKLLHCIIKYICCCPVYTLYSTLPPRKYWMLYRGPGCLSVVWFGSSPPPPPSPVSNLSLLHCLPVCRRSTLPTGEGGGGGGGAKSYDGETAWSSIYHSILSRSLCTVQCIYWKTMDIFNYTMLQLYRVNFSDTFSLLFRNPPQATT